MKAYLLMPGTGAVLILTSHPTLTDAALLRKLSAKGITKFVAFEVPVDMAKARYGEHFNIVMEDLHETDDLRVLDYDGKHSFELFSFKELGTPVFYEKMGS